ncbi:hypothetical protein [Novosphingobium sp.]|uniref:hypothetical protein n=1 Tax=Novosphingobium sp. TaxID=1874826 RepID=UPI0025D978B3|nr:hypothetical protein [Novosphingobium sp.]
MIKKPTAEWQREGEGARKAQAAVSGGLKSLQTGARVVHGGALVVQGYIGIAFGVLWILAGVASLLSGSVATLIGAGLMGLFAIWLGQRRIAKGKALASAHLPAAEKTAPDPGSADLARAVSQPGPEAGAVRALQDKAAATYQAEAAAPAFDADAIIARHLAERERLAAQAQAVPVPLVQPARPAFGRKVA